MKPYNLTSLSVDKEISKKAKILALENNITLKEMVEKIILEEYNNVKRNKHNNESFFG